MQLSRRNFLLGSAATIASIASRSVFARALAAAPATDSILVFLRLDGGNDGLNTVVPYGFESGSPDHYYTWRPASASGLGIPQSQLLTLDAELGLPPVLTHLKALWDQRKVAVVHGVGYPSPSRSHFRSSDIWGSGDPSTPALGVAGRHLDEEYDPADGIVRGVDLGGRLSRLIRAQRANLMVGSDLDDFEMPLDTSLRNDATNRLATRPQIFQLGIGGFETHSSQGWTDPSERHPRLLQQLDQCIKALDDDLAARNLSDRVVIVTISEFGRRVEPNGSHGTDHGTAGPMLVIGDGVSGGLYGTHPSLQSAALDSRGDLVYTADFRSCYATLIRDWLEGPDQLVLGADWYDTGLNFIA